MNKIEAKNKLEKLLEQRIDSCNKKKFIENLSEALDEFLDDEIYALKLKIDDFRVECPYKISLSKNDSKQVPISVEIWDRSAYYSCIDKKNGNIQGLIDYIKNNGENYKLTIYIPKKLHKKIDVYKNLDIKKVFGKDFMYRVKVAYGIELIYDNIYINDSDSKTNSYLTYNLEIANKILDEYIMKNEIHY